MKEASLLSTASVESGPNDAAPLRGSTIYDSFLRHSGGLRVDGTCDFRARDLQVALYQSPPYELKIGAIDVPRLSINLVDAAVSGGIGSDHRRDYAGRRHSLFFTPAQSDAHWIKSKCSRHLNIYFRDDLLDEYAGEGGALLRRERPLADGHLSRIKPWIEALELTIGQSGSYACDASLGLAYLIVAELARTPHRHAGRLGSSALLKVRNYVCEHLAERIHVSDLAALSGMPVGRFSLSFRTSTGFTPHRYILQLRIEAVRRLLCERRYSLAEVAAECGFASQQHMATVMRKLAGVRPSDLRAP